MTSRSNGKGYAWLKLHLTRYIRGWLTYYRYADMKTFIISTNKWYNRRLRMYIWKNWKRIRTRMANLQKCGIPKGKAWQWANTRKGYWRISKSWILTRSITNERLILAGYPSILNLYIKLHRS
ncbi:group II intron maturase-specific domain-containing protein [Phocaeicola barnesiae]|uniref:group II intron maturase-specific domain-containing protein n=1 Tax=Phocaeicola barnesiae TaxID=376804 RepID=UPI003CC7F9E7